MTESPATQIQRPFGVRGKRRCGGVTIEMILVVVVLAIATVGIVHFGVFFANIQQVALAARVGAEEASQLIDLPDSDSDPVPLPVLSAVAHQLDSSGIAYCQIRLEHNVAPPGDTVVLKWPPTTTCDCQTDNELASSPGALTAPTQYVRLTVCVPLSQVFPKSLSFFGTQLYGSDKTYEQTAIFRYELETP